MAAVTTLKLTYGFADETKRDVKIEPFDPETFNKETVRANIINFNTSDTSTIASLFLSDGGASCTGILTATIDTVEKTQINLND